MDRLLLDVYGWFAILSAVFTVLTFVSGVLFFTIGEKFGKANDIFSVFQVLLMVPVTLIFTEVAPVKYLFVVSFATLIGVVGMLISGYCQFLLVANRINFEQSRKYFPAGAAIGVWLITVNALSLVDGLLPPVLASFGILAGVGYLLTVIGFLRGGQASPLFSVGALMVGICYPVWGIWLGVLLNSGLVS